MDATMIERELKAKCLPGHKLLYPNMSGGPNVWEDVALHTAVQTQMLW